jgi:hypothetical protein
VWLVSVELVFWKWCRGGGERRERRAGSAQGIGSVTVDLGM